MSDRLDDLPAALALEIDALCDDFERHWRRWRRRGESAPAVEGFVARASFEVRATLSRCLRDLEHELRTGVALPEIPGLTVEEEIGRGGMGVVYRARLAADGRVVAVKLIPGAEHARWSRWLTDLADLRHPNLLPLESFGTHDGLHFVVMPLAAGDLKERLGEFVIGAQGGREKRRAVAKLTSKVASAVGYLHSRGILHRDLKPSNILLDSTHNPEPLVCDFGLAGRLGTCWESPGLVGTPAYMAPEQKAGEPLTTAADIWSLGAILHEMLTGRPPFIGSAGVLDFDEGLGQICLGCLQRDPHARYASADVLAAVLDEYLNSGFLT